MLLCFCCYDMFFVLFVIGLRTSVSSGISLISVNKVIKNSKCKDQKKWKKMGLVLLLKELELEWSVGQAGSVEWSYHSSRTLHRGLGQITWGWKCRRKTCGEPAVSIKHICLGKFLGSAGAALSEDESVGVREADMLLSEIGVICGRRSIYWHFLARKCRVGANPLFWI